MNKYYWFNLFIFIIFDISYALAQWEQVNQNCNGRISGFICNSDTLYVSSFEQGIFYSTNYGDTWKTFTIPDLRVQSLDVIGRTIIAGSWDGIYYSSNFGSSWELIKYPDYQNFRAKSLIKINNKILAGTEGRGIYITTDLGLSWQNITIGPDSLYYTNVKVLFKSYDNILASIYRKGIYSSSYYGTNWVNANNGLTDENVTCFAKNDTIIYVGTDNGGGLFYSKDSAKTWNSGSHWGLASRFLSSISATDKNLFALTDHYNIYFTSDNGNKWQIINTATIPDPYRENKFNCISVFGNYLFAGTSEGIWRCSLSHITSVENEDRIFNNYDLLQNYPNPFNPTTKIEYSIPKASFAILKVYDLLGREVATLVNEEKSIGNYNVEFNGSALSSGIYFYRIAIHSDKLQAGDYSSVKKMILIK